MAILLFKPILSSNAQIVVEDFNDSKLSEGWQSLLNTGTCRWDRFTIDPPKGDKFDSIALIFDDNRCGPDAGPSNVSLL